MQRFIRIDHPSAADRYRLPEEAVVELEILRGRARQRLRLVEVPVFLIGTAGDCDLVLAEPGIPPVHTYLYLRPEGVSIRALAPPPLTVNGRVVENALLADGDQFGIGPFEFVIHIRCGRPVDELAGGRRAGRQLRDAPETGEFGQGGESQGGALDAAQALDVVRQSILVRKLRLFAEPPRPQQVLHCPCGERASA
jgi:hypothetical protein